MTLDEIHAQFIAKSVRAGGGQAWLEAKAQIEKQLLSLVPEKEKQPTGLAGEYFNGYNQAIDDITKQIKEFCRKENV